MKPKFFSLNHTELVPANTKHNLLHHFLTSLIKLFSFLIYSFLGFYLLGFGLLGATPALKISEKTNRPFLKLPLFSDLRNLILNSLGNSLLKIPVWSFLVIALPLIIFGIALIVNNFFDFLLSLFSSEYNHTHCFFCKQPFKIREKINWKRKRSGTKQNAKT